MSSFTEPLITETKVAKVRKKFLWIFPYTSTKLTHVVRKPFRYYVGYEGSDDYIDIPEGFETDFNSIPFGARNLFPKNDVNSQIAVVHDMCYQKQLYSQKKCDQIYLEGSKILGYPWWKRYLAYGALRAFGWISYNKNKKPEVSYETSRKTV